MGIIYPNSMFSKPRGLCYPGGDWVASLVAGYSPLALYAADRGLYSDAGTTPAVANDPVYQWNDQSGNGRHLTQTTLAARPTLTANYQNGKPAVVFDGVDDYLQASAFQAWPSKRGAAAAVFKNTLAGLYCIVSSSYTGAGTPFSLSSPIGGTNYSFYDGAGATWQTSAVPDGSNATIKTWWRDSNTTMKHRRDGAAADDFTLTDGQTTSQSVAVGSHVNGVAPLFKGGIAAVAFFPDRTLAEVQAIESILNSAWAVY